MGLNGPAFVTDPSIYFPTRPLRQSGRFFAGRQFPGYAVSQLFSKPNQCKCGPAQEAM